MHKGLYIFLLLLTACSTTSDLDETVAVAMALPLLPQAPQAEDVLFASLQKQDDKRWQLLSMASKRMPVDLLKGEERVFIRTGTQRVMPDYDHHQYRDADKRLFDCGQQVTYNKHTTYNPCVSLLSRNTRFGDGWFGWTRRLDVTELELLVKQTDLLALAKQKMVLVNQERQRCANLRKQAEQLAAQQKLSLRVIDETSMFKNGHELVSYGLKVHPEISKEGCEQALANVKLSYAVDVVQDFDMVFELRGKTDWRKLDEHKLNLQRRVAESDKTLQPTLYITGKKVSHYNLYKTFANKDLQLTWRTIDISDTDLRQVFDIKNLADSPIQVQSVTFHINKHRITRRNQYHLSPLADQTGLEHASRYFLLQETLRRNIDAIKIIDQKTEEADFGISITYSVAGEARHMSSSNRVLLTSIL